MLSYPLWAYAAILALAVLWVMGFIALWRRQTRSRHVVTVGIADRLIAIFWLPLYAATLSWLCLLMIMEAIGLTRPNTGRK
jgi:branched-subunit amino acid permease